jgi:AcrR family transcriptional regulator
MNAPVEPRTRRGRETREALVRAARRRFIADGYLNTSVPAITKDAGRSQGSFYTYFDSKAHLLRVLAAEAIDRLAARLQQVLAEDLAAASLVERMTAAVWDAYREDIAVLVSVYQTATRDLVLDDWTRLREVVVAAVLEVDRRAVTAGAPAPDDELATARTVASMLESACFTWITERHDSPAVTEAAIDATVAVPTLAAMWTAMLRIPSPGERRLDAQPL